MRLLGLIFGLFLVLGGNGAEKETLSTQSLSTRTIKSGDTAEGIDVSFYQKDIEWWKLKSVHFAFIKATEGVTIKDPRFNENWDSSKKEGILRGAYHFYRPHIPAKEQFNHFKSVVSVDSGDLPPVLDLEVNTRYPQHFKKEVLVWLEMAEEHYGVTPIIYCTHWFYQRYLSYPEFDHYPLWIANYVAQDLNKVTSDWHFWQHTSTGKIDGISGHVDRNLFNGSYESLLSLCKR